MALVRFRSDTANFEKITWDERMAAWNRQHPQGQYVNTQRFAGDLSRAEEQMLRPQSALARQRQRFRRCGERTEGHTETS